MASNDAAALQNYLERPSTPSPTPTSSKRAKVSPDAVASNDTAQALQDCLSRCFGFSSFRPGQLEAIQAVLNGQDVAVFWAAASGRSLTYTLPALFLRLPPQSLRKKVAIVVSPFISLMEDQVGRLNELVNIGQGDVATLLGSAKRDYSHEDRALQGEFPLIFVTPEKLMSPGFLDRMVGAELDICLVAIVESHLVRYDPMDDAHSSDRDGFVSTEF